MVRLLPMFVTGCICNLIVALVVGRLDFVLLIRALSHLIIYKDHI